MRKWNEALVADDAEFWRSTILAFAAWGRAGTPSPDGSAAAALGRTASNTPAIPAFRFPAAPPVPAEGQLEDPCGLLAAHCRYEVEIPEVNSYETRAQGEWRTGPYECCANAWALQHGPFGPNSSASDPGVPAGGGCLSDPSQCSEVILRYGTHLLQELPPLDAS